MMITRQKAIWHGERCGEFPDHGISKFTESDLATLVYGLREGPDAPRLTLLEARDLLRRLWELLDSAIQYWWEQDWNMLTWALEEAYNLEAPHVHQTAAEVLAGYMGMQRLTL